MTSAINRFYIFVTQKYQDWDRLRSDMDCINSDGVITLGEFSQFINTEAGQLQFNRGDINDVFGKLNINTKGKVHGHSDIYEQTALNEGEQSRIEANIELYGEIITNLTEAYENSGNIDSYVSGHSSLGLSKEKVIQLAFELLMEGRSITDAKNISEQDLNAFLKKAIAEIVKEYYLGQYEAQVQAKVGNDYPGLKNDPQLNALIKSFIDDKIAYGTNPNSMWDGTNKPLDKIIENIIKNYLADAKIITTLSNTNPNDPDYTTYHYHSDKMDSLKLSVLCKKWTGILKSEDFSSYNSFIDINVVIDRYIQTKRELWEANPSWFKDIYNKDVTYIRPDFENSIQSLTKALAISNIGSGISANSSVELPSEDNQWKLTIDGQEGNGMYKSLYDLLGLGALGEEEAKKYLKKLFTDGLYKGIVQRAYSDIEANPDEYGIDLKNCTEGQLRNAIRKYIAMHAKEILTDLGIGSDGGKKDMALMLTQNAYQTAYWAGQTPSWNGFDKNIARAVVSNLIMYLTSLNDPVINKYIEDCGLTAGEIVNLDANQIASRMNNLYNKLKSYDFSGKVDGDENHNPDPTQVDDFHVSDEQLKNIFGDISDNSTGSVRMLCSSGSGGVGGWSYAKEEAISNFKAMTGSLKVLAIQAGIDYDIAQNAADILVEYFTAVLSTYDSLFNEDLGSSGSTGSPYIGYGLSMGNDKTFKHGDIELSLNSVYAISDTDRKINSVAEISGSSSGSNNAGITHKSASGIYVGCDLDDKWFSGSDDFCIGVDGKTIYEIYKQILGSLLK